MLVDSGPHGDLGRSLQAPHHGPIHAKTDASWLFSYGPSALTRYSLAAEAGTEVRNRYRPSASGPSKRGVQPDSSAPGDRGPGLPART